ncbi:Cysteine-rich secretory protein family protein [Rubripirellula obstinata]|uniref:Cysteine-rich secretory protein family protein n=1 Tax=Rubripirellula obstinata TaxID=406547 RepID=A0A5B1CMF6_9BACT|nr:CAP domain-containing protein [Rubripirellula obstinata]KAA1261461.1 Cysteine-rich secretory protein family protein [Rubripirellula obstinata]
MRSIYLLVFLIQSLVVGDLIAKEPSHDNRVIRNVESAIVAQTNSFREDNGLEPVSTDQQLIETASKFAKFMAETGKYGHRADGRSPAGRAKASGYRYCVVRENIAYRTNTGEVTADDLTKVFMQGWIESPPHRENMLADYVTETGVAVATTDGVTYYAVQLFGRPKSAAIELEVTNKSSDAKALEITPNDSEDTVELPPRAVIRMKRCFPITIQVQGSDNEMAVTQSTHLLITNDGVENL